MKTKIVIILLASMLMMSITACGNDAAEAAESVQATATPVVMTAPTKEPTPTPVAEVSESSEEEMEDHAYSLTMTVSTPETSPAMMLYVDENDKPIAVFLENEDAESVWKDITVSDTTVFATIEDALSVIDVNTATFDVTVNDGYEVDKDTILANANSVVESLLEEVEVANADVKKESVDTSVSPTKAPEVTATPAPTPEVTAIPVPVIESTPVPEQPKVEEPKVDEQPKEEAPVSEPAQQPEQTQTEAPAEQPDTGNPPPIVDNEWATGTEETIGMTDEEKAELEEALKALEDLEKFWKENQ